MRTLKEKINHLIDICHESVSIEVNEHYRGSGEKVRQYLQDCNQDLPSEEIMQEIEKTNRFIWVTAYPRNQISSFRIIHYDVESAIDIIIPAVEQYIKEYDR